VKITSTQKQIPRQRGKINWISAIHFCVACAKYRDPFFDIPNRIRALWTQIAHMKYHKLCNVLGPLSVILSRDLNANSQPWLRVEHLGISVIFKGRHHTQAADSHCYASGTLKLCPNSHCKFQKLCKDDEVWFTETLMHARVHVSSSIVRKPPTGGWQKY